MTRQTSHASAVAPVGSANVAAPQLAQSIPLRWRVLIHVIWFVSAASILGLLINVWGIQGRAILAEQGGPSAWAIYTIVSNIIIRSLYFGVAVLIFWRKSDEWIAILVSLTLMAMGASTADLATVQAMSPFWQTLAGMASGFGWTTIWILLYLFPDGRFVPRWTRFLAAIFVVLQVMVAFKLPLNYTTWPVWLELPILLALVSPTLFAQIYRYRRVSTTMQRQQTKWVIFGFAVVLVTAAVLDVLEQLLPHYMIAGWSITEIRNVVQGHVMPVLPLTLGIAVLRYRLWDIDPIINRTLVYGTITALIVSIYVLIVGYLGALFQTSGNLVISLIATGIVAVLFQPLRDRLQRGVNRLMYGKRDEPYAVISQLGQRLEATLAPDAILPAIVETVREALKLPYAAIALHSKNQEPRTENPEVSDGSEIVAASGTPVDELLRLPLVYQHEPVGALILAPRGPGEPFSPADRRLLDDLARQAGVAVHSVRLTSDLQRANEELQRARIDLVTAREEERRRLRRDLHDGLGSVLASLNLRAGAIRTLLTRNPAAADALAVEQQSTIRSAIADVRRLVHQLRPPALDELGLAAALREQAARYQDEHTGSPLRVIIDMPESLPPLPAAVEVAAYRIVQEALTNVIRHAQASRCQARIADHDQQLQVEISDDGVGLPEGYRAGVGVLSMRERAEELGGTCVVERAVEGGTIVRTWLPSSSVKHET